MAPRTPMPAGVGHRGHHVAAVGEGEDREFDAESVADLGVHGVSLWVSGGQFAPSVSALRWAVDRSGRLVGRVDGASGGCGVAVTAETTADTTAGRAGVAPVTAARMRATSSVSRLCGVDAVLGLEADRPGPGTPWRGCRGRRDGMHQPSSIQAAKPLVSQSWASRARARIAVATSGSRAARSHSSRSSKEQATGLVARVRDHIGGHGPQAVLDGGGQFELGGDHGHERMRPIVEQRQEQSLLRAEVGVHRTRRPPGRSGTASTDTASMPRSANRVAAASSRRARVSAFRSAGSVAHGALLAPGRLPKLDRRSLSKCA